MLLLHHNVRYYYNYLVTMENNDHRPPQKQKKKRRRRDDIENKNDGFLPKRTAATEQHEDNFRAKVSLSFEAVAGTAAAVVLLPFAVSLQQAVTTVLRSASATYQKERMPMDWRRRGG